MLDKIKTFFCNTTQPDILDEQLKNTDKTIKMPDIAKLFKKVEQRKQLKGYNSVVAPEGNYEYQIDLMV